MLEGLSCIWGFFPGGLSSLGSHLMLFLGYCRLRLSLSWVPSFRHLLVVSVRVHFPVWFPHCPDVPWDFSGGGVPFCPILCPPFTLGDVCQCFPHPDCVFSDLVGFLGWCLLLLHPPTVVLLDVPDASLCWPGSSLSSF